MPSLNDTSEPGCRGSLSLKCLVSTALKLLAELAWSCVELHQNAASRRTLRPVPRRDRRDRRVPPRVMIQMKSYVTHDAGAHRAESRQPDKRRSLKRGGTGPLPICRRRQLFSHGRRFSCPCADKECFRNRLFRATVGDSAKRALADIRNGNQLFTVFGLLPRCSCIRSPDRATHGAMMAVNPVSDPRQNQLLAALPTEEFDRWHPHLQAVELTLGRVLYEPGDVLSHVYFPTTAIVSLLYVMENGASAEIAVAGREALVGISLFMGGQSTPSRAVVQSGGHGFRMKAQTLTEEFNRSGPVLHLLLRYTQALITQMAQTAVCNRHHSLDQQLCRWLLLSLDRLPGKELVMTQELIANMLGVRREGVTEGAITLQRAGIIDYSRGHITVLDRPRLETLTCECYAVVKKEYDRLLPATIAL